MITVSIAALTLAASVFFISYFLLDGTVGETAFRKERFQLRLHGIKKASRIDVEKKNRYSDIRALNEIFKRRAVIARIERMLKAGGWGISVGVFVLGSLLGSFFLYLVLARAGFSVMFSGLISGLVLFLVPGGALKYRYAKYLDLFSQRFPTALQIMRGAVGVGFGLPQALERVAHDAPFPVNKEFQTLLSEMQLGESLTAALEGLLKRVPNHDVRTFTVAASIQQESGGNLSELISKLENTINARVMLRKELGSLTAQARLSGWVLIVLPFALALLLNTINPEYLKPLFESEMGRKTVLYTIMMMIAGSVIIKRMVSIRLPV